MNFWVPVIFGAFKLIVLGTFMFLAIRSHREGEKEDKKKKELQALKRQQSSPHCS